MKPEFELFLQKYDELIEARITQDELFRSHNIDLLTDEIHNLRKARHPILKAFTILSSTELRKESKNEDGNSVPDWHHMDRTEEWINAAVPHSEVDALANAIGRNDHIAFFEVMDRLTKNTSLSRRYTKAIFGKAPKK